MQETLKRSAAALRDAEIPFALAGGLAVWARGGPESDHDLDFLAYHPPGRFEEHRRVALERGERVFARHGSKAVFFGRWITGLRVWASWIAGMTHLP